ncbi:MAG: DUF2157 domain-containing protein [Anaerolineae bacterium]
MNETASVSGDVPTAISGSRWQWLAGEIRRWRASGMITEQQSREILAQYAPQRESALQIDPVPVDEVAEEHTGPGRLIAVVSALGAILLGFGAILFFAANWETLPPWSKVALIWTAIGAAFGAGYYLRYRPGNYPRVGNSLILLGALFYGAGIFLTMQIFNMNADNPVGVLLWTIGVLPLAYTLAHRGLLGLGLLTFLLWLGWVMADGSSDGSLVDFLAIYLAAGLAYVALGYQHGLSPSPWAPFGGTYRGIGMIVAMTALHVMTYGSTWEVDGWLSGASTGSSGLSWAIALCALAAVAGASLLLRLTADRPTLPWEALAVVVIAVLAGLGTSSFGGSAILFNLVYFAAALGIVAVGYLNAEPYAVNIGLLFFAVGVIARYFDFFWDLMPRSVFFMAGGLILIVGSLALERSRRRMLSSIRSA